MGIITKWNLDTDFINCYDNPYAKSAFLKIWNICICCAPKVSIYLIYEIHSINKETQSIYQMETAQELYDLFWTNPGRNTPRNNNCTATYLPSLKPSRCPWCNGYRRRKWTRRHEFKSWTRLIAFQIALIPLGKVWIQLFSLQLWVNSRAD